MVGAESRGDGDAVQTIANNRLTDNGGKVKALVVNWGAAAPVVTGNQLPAHVTPLATDGILSHRVRANLSVVKGALSAVAQKAKRAVSIIAGQ